MAYLLAHLTSGWAVDQAILKEEDRVVVIRFGHDHDATCMEMDEVLSGEQQKAPCASSRVCEPFVSCSFQATVCEGLLPLADSGGFAENQATEVLNFAGLWHPLLVMSCS